MTPLRLRPGVHWTLTHPLVRTLRRALRDPNIMCYWHTQANALVIGTWFNKRCGLVCEHATIPARDLFNPDIVRSAFESVMYARGPVAHQGALELRRAIEDAEDADVLQAQDELDVHSDCVEHLRRQADGHRDDPYWLRM